MNYTATDKKKPDSPFHYAVIGNPIEHSLSPRLQKAFADQMGLQGTYRKLLASHESFESCVRQFFQEGGTAMNVTAPFKQQAYALADVKSERAMLAHAANTLWMREGKLQADNTDGVGFVHAIQQFIDLEDKRVLMLGAGGAVQGILPEVLKIKNCQVTIVNRTETRLQTLKKLFPAIHCFSVSRQSLLQEVPPPDVVINACSNVIFSQKVVERLSPPSALRGNSANVFCYDLSYSATGETPFVRAAKKQGYEAQDGLSMLIEQAAEAFFVWHGYRVPDLNQKNLELIFVTPSHRDNPAR